MDDEWVSIVKGMSDEEMGALVEWNRRQTAAMFADLWGRMKEKRDGRPEQAEERP